MTRRTVTLVVASPDPATVDEALRAAVGLTLRGDALTVVLDPATALDRPATARARATLALFHHHVTAAPDALAAALDADALEIWGTPTPTPPTPTPPTPAARRRTLLHLVRPGHRAASVATADQVLHLDDALDDDRLLDLVLAADAVAVW